jgi:hypothetical protein
MHFDQIIPLFSPHFIAKRCICVKVAMLLVFHLVLLNHVHEHAQHRDMSQILARMMNNATLMVLYGRD